MNHAKIDVGIDLGTTNSAIAVMNHGVPEIQKIEVTDDIMPSCVAFNRKGTMFIGKQAYAQLGSDKRRALLQSAQASNAFIEFKRTMGLDTEYVSTHAGRSFRSEELSAEVLIRLKSFARYQPVRAAVITVPAQFTINQKDATLRAAKLAGIEHTELLQEPIAAAMAYGLQAEEKNGYWLVFDFGGGTFDVALLYVEDGIMQVLDTDGDNYLGGKNLDYAIVDELLIPSLKETYAMERLLGDKEGRIALREALKTLAEPAKNALSFAQCYDMTTDLGDLGNDDEGEEMELDLTLDAATVNSVLAPVFQRAIDICKRLLERNRLGGEQIQSVILVGGPTYSPLLRGMLREQIADRVDTSVDPMTVVTRGAALYASTLDHEGLEEGGAEQKAVYLELSYESTTVSLEEYVTIKCRPGEGPCTVEFVRADHGWSSGRIPVDDVGNVVELSLREGKVNTFEISVYDAKGLRIDASPREMTIIQGSKIGSATLPYDIGIEVVGNPDSAGNPRTVLSAIDGLRKNTPLPAVGTKDKLRTPNQLRPGVEEDLLKIPVYQGGYAAEGVRAVLHEHVYDFIITGADVPTLVPEGSEVELTVRLDLSERLSLSVYFPGIDYSTDITVDSTTVQKEVSSEYIMREIVKGRSDIERLRKEGEPMDELSVRLDHVEDELNNGHQWKQVLDHLKEVLRDVDRRDSEGEWGRMEKNLRNKFDMLKRDNLRYGNPCGDEVEEIRRQVERVRALKDLKMASLLLDKLFVCNFKIARIDYFAAWLYKWDKEFAQNHWKNCSRARQLIDRGKRELLEGCSAERLSPLIQELGSLLPLSETPYGSEGLLHA